MNHICIVRILPMSAFMYSVLKGIEIGLDQIKILYSKVMVYNIDIVFLSYTIQTNEKKTQFSNIFKI